MKDTNMYIAFSPRGFSNEIRRLFVEAGREDEAIADIQSVYNTNLNADYSLIYKEEDPKKFAQAIYSWKKKLYQNIKDGGDGYFPDSFEAYSLGDWQLKYPPGFNTAIA